MSYYEIYSEIAIASPVVPLFFLFYKRKEWNRTAVVVGLILGLNIGTDYFSSLLILLKTPSFLVFELYSIPLCWFVLELYKTEVKNKKVQNGLLAFQILYPFFAMYQFRHIHDQAYNELPYTLLSATIIMLSIYYFYYTFIRMEVGNLFESPMFWINSAILIYFGGTFFVTLFEDIAREFGRERVQQLWLVQNSIAIIFNLIMARGTWEMKRT